MSLRRLDLNLLTVFEAVYEERSQLKAAERLHMSQPAISQSISRLRSLLDDRLFFGQKVLQTTPRADELYMEVHKALDLIRLEIIWKEGFDPATSKRAFSVSAQYGGGYQLATPLYQLFHSLAPHAQLVIRMLDPHAEVPRLLRQREIDLVLSHLDLQDDMLETARALDFDLVVMGRPEHPTLREHPSLSMLESLSYLWVHDSLFLTELPELQEFLRMAASRTTLEVPNALMLPIILSQTDLISITSRSMAKAMYESHGIAFYELPFEQKGNHSRFYWHRSQNHDHGHTWFRDLCQTVIQSINQNDHNDIGPADRRSEQETDGRTVARASRRAAKSGGS